MPPIENGANDDKQDRPPFAQRSSPLATTLPVMSDGRPAGGTSRHAGIKTQRKVQWSESTESLTKEHSHVLDEHGRDPTALKELTEALERHQSSKRRPTRIHYFPPRQPDPRFPKGSLPKINTEDIEIQQEGPSTSTSASPISPPTHTQVQHHEFNIPGYYIGAGEKVGLPSSDDPEEAALRSASRVVRSHTHRNKKGFLGLKRRAARSPSPPRARGAQLARVRSSEDIAMAPLTKDVERTVPSSSPSSKPFGGVLSALLSLYDDDRSGYSTPGYTPSVLSARSSFDEERRPLSKSPFKDEQASKMAEKRDEKSGESTKSHSREPSRDSPASATPSSGANTPSKKDRQSPTSKILSALDFSSDPRPPQARNSGGVFGTLIASTGNITGVAAPVQSQIQPNVKRPGYHLTRYSHDDSLSTPASLREEQESLIPNVRPKSMQFEPGSGGSNSEGSPNKPLGIDSDSEKPSSKWMGGLLKDLPTGMYKLASSVVSTPGSDKDEWLSEKVKKPEDERRRRRKGRRKEAEIFITRHVAQILARQEFICKLARAMMMFGAPSHRLPSQIQATARVLEIEMSCMYLPDLMLLSFDDNVTSTSNIKFIRQGSALDLTKLDDSYGVFWQVIHDELSVSEASNALDQIMKSPQIYRPWQLCVFGGMCSAAICIVGFSGSFLDGLMAFPMGATLVAFQLLTVRNELYSNIFEITIATMFSFLSAALATTKYFCYSALASASVVLILPGFIVTLGSLELISRNLISGSVRLCYAVVYSLFLGFGIAMGAQIFEKITGLRVVKFDDLSCSLTHYDNGPWYIQTPQQWWYFLAVPMFALFLSMRNFASWNRREIVLLVLFACMGWVTNHFVSPYFEGQSDVSAAVGAFVVGFIANVYARIFSKNAFVVMITGILFQVPSGLGNGGLLNYAEERSNAEDETKSTAAYISGFQTALQLISVAIGLAIGLSLSLFVVHPIPSRRLRGGVFSL